MIRAEGVTRRFGRITAVERVDFTVPQGSITGFVGPNGAGKSTVLRMLCGLVRPSAGRVLVAGLDPSHRSLEVRRALGYLPGETSVYVHMTGRAYLAFTGSFRAAIDGELLERLPRLFELPLDRKIRTYSAGMKQKLALAAVLSAEVPLLILDEPTRALDATMRAQFLEALAILHGRGRTIFLSSHHLADIERACQGMIFLMQGRVVEQARVEALRRELAALVRVRLAPGASPADLPLAPGEAWEERNQLLRIRAQGDPRELAARLAGAPITALSWGRVELEEIYAHLYLQATDGRLP